MKKIFAGLLVSLCISAVLFAEEQTNMFERWTGFGFVTNNGFALTDNRNGHLLSFGMYAEEFRFFEGKNYGGYYRYSFSYLLPDDDIFPAETDFANQHNFVIGFAGKIPVSEGVDLYGTFVASQMVLFSSTHNRSLNAFYLAGLGLDLGIKIDITDNWYVNVGNSFTYYFNRPIVDMSISPFIGIGHNFWGTSFRGKNR